MIQSNNKTTIMFTALRKLDNIEFPFNFEKLRRVRAIKMKEKLQAIPNFKFFDMEDFADTFKKIPLPKVFEMSHEEFYKIYKEKYPYAV